MVANSMVNSSMTRRMVWVFSTGPMVESIREAGNKICKTVKAFTSKRMVRSSTAFGPMASAFNGPPVDHNQRHPGYLMIINQ